jgi:hypothetical protein
MRKITQKKYRKTKARTKINIQHNKRRGKESYEQAVDKFKIIFGEKAFDKILYYSKPSYIQKLIDLLNFERNKPKNSNLNNNEQITNILHPALEAFLNFIRNEYFALRAVIPYIVNTDKVLNPKRIAKILRLAKENKAIEEFIRDLEVLKLGPNSTINVPPISSPVLVPELAPTSELVPPPPLVPTPPPPPPPSPSQYKSKSPHKSRSPRKSRSPYESKSPRKSRSPEAIEVTRVSKRTPGSIRVIPIIYPSSGGRHNKTINKVYSSNKKTRRYKKH